MIDWDEYHELLLITQNALKQQVDGDISADVQADAHIANQQLDELEDAEIDRWIDDYYDSLRPW